MGLQFLGSCMEKEIPRGQLSTVILSTLTGGDKYGYEIIKEIEERTNGALKIKQPSLYSSLNRMETQGLISSYWRDSDIGGKRHYYRLTDFGRKQVDEWQNDLIKSQTTVNKLFSSQEEGASYLEKPPETLKEQVEDKEEEKPVEAMREILSSPPERYDVTNELNALRSGKSFAEMQKEIAEKKLREEPLEFLEQKEEHLQKEDNDLPPKEVESSENLNLTSSPPTYIENPPLEEKPQLEPEPEEEKDEGIFITEKPDPEDLPKVRRIEPASFVISSDNKLLRPTSPEATYNELVNDLYSRGKKSEEDDLNYNSYYTLSNHYKNLNIRFCEYKKSKEKVELFKDNILINKYNLIRCSAFAGLMLLEIWMLYLIFSLSGLNPQMLFLYIGASLLVIAWPLSSLFIYLQNKDKQMQVKKYSRSQMIFNAVAFVIAGLLLLSINLLFGVDNYRMQYFCSTFIMPLILLTNIVLMPFVSNFLMKKLQN